MTVTHRPQRRPTIRRARILHVVDLSVANPWFNGIAEHYDRDRFDQSLVTIGPRCGLHDDLELRDMRAEALDVTHPRAYPRAIGRLGALLRRARVDLVQTHGFYPSLVGLAAATLAGTPVKVVTRHHGDFTTLFRRPVHRRLDRLQTQWADHVFAASGAVRDAMVWHEHASPGKVSVTWYGYDFDVLRPRLSADARRRVRDAIGGDDRIIAVSVARLSPEKGHEYLLRAAPAVIENRPELMFVLVGDGPLRQELMTRTRVLGVDDHVRFLGWRTDAWDLIEASDLVVHPSLHEAFCSVIIEAMALERPLVATDVGGAPEQVDSGATGVLVPPRDPDAIEAAIEDVLREGRGAEMGVEARQRVVSRFGIGRMVRHYEGLYDQLLGRPPAPEPGASPTARISSTGSGQRRPEPGGEQATPIERDLVYDVGMHRGDDTAFYLSRGFRVVGVEANPTLVASLRERFAAEIRTGRLVIVPTAVGAHRGTVRFAAVDGGSVLSTADPAYIERLERLSADFEMIDVAVTTLADVVARYGLPYFMKVDIEGMDHAAVATLESLDRRPARLSMESVTAGPHAKVRGVVAELALLRRLGYRRFKLVDQARLSALDGAFLDQEGEPVVYHHAEWTSGPFGDEAPGRWRGALSVTPWMLGRCAQHHLLAEAGWFPSTRLGRGVRGHVRRLATTQVPDLHLGRQFGGYEWYDIHASM